MYLAGSAVSPLGCSRRRCGACPWDQFPDSCP